MGQEQFGQGNVQAAARETGVWKAVPFKASNFKAKDPMVMTINGGAGAIVQNRYCTIGRNAGFYTLYIAEFQLTGTASDELQFLVPFSIARQTYFVASLYNNSWKPCIVRALPAYGITPAMFQIRNMPTGPFNIFNYNSIEFTIPLELGKSYMLP